MLYVLDQWGFEQNRHRKSVMQPGQTWVHSDTLRMIRFKDDASVHVSPATLDYPFVTSVLNLWMKRHLPVDFVWTSISVNKNYAGFIHRDAFNAGPSALLALGDFQKRQSTTTYLAVAPFRTLLCAAKMR